MNISGDCNLFSVAGFEIIDLHTQVSYSVVGLYFEERMILLNEQDFIFSGAVYYNDCSLEPRLFVYLLVSSSLLLLYLPIIANLGQKALGLKVYIRLITFLQLVGLSFGE